MWKLETTLCSSSALWFCGRTGFPGGSDGKKSACNAGDLGSIPGLGRSPGGGHGNPLQSSCLEKPHGQRGLVGYSPQGCKELDTTEWLSTRARTDLPVHLLLVQPYRYAYVQRLRLDTEGMLLPAQCQSIVASSSSNEKRASCPVPCLFLFFSLLVSCLKIIAVLIPRKATL